MKKIDIRFGVLVAIILVAAFSRMIPHPFNFSPLGAIGLFGAAHFTKKWQALVIPVAAAFLSDIFINNVIYAAYYPSFTWFAEGFYWQYGSYILIAAFGILLYNKGISAPKILGGALASSLLFFLISNFGCFIGSATYPQNVGGLMACYAAGLPFVNGTVMGDLFYNAILFGTFALLQNRFSALKLA